MSTGFTKTLHEQLQTNMSPCHGILKCLVSLMALSVSLASHGDETSPDDARALGDIQASRETPKVYATPNYGLTFRVPPHSFYCPLPASWVGSDHGTLIFLESPGNCGGNGYASSSRSFERDVARIEIYYGHDMSEDDGSSTVPQQCDAVAHWRFLGRRTAICKTTEHDRIVLTAQAKYMASSPAEAAFSLVTSASRFTDDLVAFRALVESAKPCRVEGKNRNGQTERFGTGRLCPPGTRWF